MVSVYTATFSLPALQLMCALQDTSSSVLFELGMQKSLEKAT